MSISFKGFLLVYFQGVLGIRNSTHHCRRNTEMHNTSGSAHASKEIYPSRRMRKSLFQ
ncbi:hypothetical protein AMTRI_Chr02g265450 [Amborella trichopoda]